VRPSYGFSLSQPEAHVDQATAFSSRRLNPEPITGNLSAAMAQAAQQSPISVINKPAKLSIMDLVEDRRNEIEQRIAPQLTVSNSTNGKRKADEISTDVPNVGAPAEATVTADREDVAPGPGPSVPLPLEPLFEVPQRPRPVKKARFQRAATEMGKYAVGMALGGVGTIAFLCSPLAEKLLA